MATRGIQRICKNGPPSPFSTPRRFEAEFFGGNAGLQAEKAVEVVGSQESCGCGNLSDAFGGMLQQVLNFFEAVERDFVVDRASDLPLERDFERAP